MTHDMFYIENYKYSRTFDLNNFFGNLVPGIDYEPSWPAIIVSTSRLEFDSYIKIHDNFRSGKTKSKPQMCLRGGPESVHQKIIEILKLQSLTFSVLSSCTSAAYAMYQAGLISQDLNSPVLVICADNFSEMNYHWFHSIGAVSLETGIPFDKHSKGFRPGQGQAMFVISKKKPKNPLAIVETMRFSTDSEQITRLSNPSALLKLFHNLDLKDIGWWNAHAPGTPIGDQTEYDLFSMLKMEIPISSVKASLGHALASSYLLELGVVFDNLLQKQIPENLNITEKIVNDDRIIVAPVEMTKNRFIKFSLGFGGKNILSILRMCD